MPHKQARIRFALDNNTWLRLQGLHKTLPNKFQGKLSKEEATKIWLSRVKSSLKALVKKFHLQYGPPEAVFILGGNSLQCYEMIKEIIYENPDVIDASEYVGNYTTISNNNISVSTAGGNITNQTGNNNLQEGEKFSPSSSSSSSSIFDINNLQQEHNNSIIANNSSNFNSTQITNAIGNTSDVLTNTISQIQSTTSTTQQEQKGLLVRVPVIIQSDDITQQDITMSGLLQSTRFKVKQVYSSGNDPLDRGWTRGGEIYHWIPRRPKNINDNRSTRRLERESTQSRSDSYQLTNISRESTKDHEQGNLMMNLSEKQKYNSTSIENYENNYMKTTIPIDSETNSLTKNLFVDDIVDIERRLSYTPSASSSSSSQYHLEQYNFEGNDEKNDEKNSILSPGSSSIASPNPGVENVLEHQLFLSSNNYDQKQNQHHDSNEEMNIEKNRQDEESPTESDHILWRRPIESKVSTI